MSDSESMRQPASERKGQTEIERLAAQARSGWDKEARTLSWFGLEDGMSVLELGSGPGYVTEQLAALVPTSPITCVEIDRTMLDQAEQTIKHENRQRVRLVEGSVMDMHLESDQFDFAYARFLFQHLTNPIGAGKEIWRVLKPGGKLVICDIDDQLYREIALIDADQIASWLRNGGKSAVEVALEEGPVERIAAQYRNHRSDGSPEEDSAEVRSLYASGIGDARVEFLLFARNNPCWLVWSWGDDSDEQENLELSIGKPHAIELQ